MTLPTHTRLTVLLGVLVGFASIGACSDSEPDSVDGMAGASGDGGTSGDGDGDGDGDGMAGALGDGDTAEPLEYLIEGVSQKGPMLSGSSVIVQELDEGFEQTGTIFETETLDDTGNFRISRPCPLLLLI